MAHPASGAAVSKRNHTLGFHETEGVGVGTVIVGVVASFAIVTILAYGAVPDSMGRMDLFAEATAVREWEGSLRAACQCVLIVILGHGVPPEVMVMGIFYGCG